MKCDLYVRLDQKRSSESKGCYAFFFLMLIKLSEMTMKEFPSSSPQLGIFEFLILNFSSLMVEIFDSFCVRGNHIHKSG